MPADELRDAAPASADSDDTDFGDSPDEVDWTEEPEPKPEHKTTRAVVAAIILIVVAVLVFLLLRECTNTTVSGTEGNHTVVSVPPTVRRENTVALWLKGNTSLGAVLDRTGVRTTSSKSMSQGLYFLFLPDGENAAGVIAKLKRDREVYDAGYVYDELKSGGETGTASTTTP